MSILIPHKSCYFEKLLKTVKEISFFMIYLTKIEQIASNKSSLLLKIHIQNTQTLQWFTEIINAESIYESY